MSKMTSCETGGRGVEGGRWNSIGWCQQIGWCMDHRCRLGPGTWDLGPGAVQIGHGPGASIHSLAVAGAEARCGWRAWQCGGQPASPCAATASNRASAPCARAPPGYTRK
eukprot:4848315-Prymnesium_polylepis.1